MSLIVIVFAIYATVWWMKRRYADDVYKAKIILKSGRVCKHDFDTAGFERMKQWLSQRDGIFEAEGVGFYVAIQRECVEAVEIVRGK